MSDYEREDNNVPFSVDISGYLYEPEEELLIADVELRDRFEAVSAQGVDIQQV